MPSRSLDVLLSVVSSTSPATSEIYTLSLHDALPILRIGPHCVIRDAEIAAGAVIHPFTHIEGATVGAGTLVGDRKSTRLNSSHANISYAVFCLKKKTLSPWTPSHLIKEVNTVQHAAV